MPIPHGGDGDVAAVGDVQAWQNGEARKHGHSRRISVLSTHRRFGFRLAAVAVFAATALGAPPAGAERFIHVDPAQDMWTRDGGRFVRDPQHRNFDIRTVVVRHRLHRVTIHVKLRGLNVPSVRRGAFGLGGFIRVNRAAQPSEGRVWEWRAWFEGNKPHDPRFLEVLDNLHQEEGGCFAASNRNSTGMRAHLHYKRNTVDVSIPRRCIGRTSGFSDPVLIGPAPQWIRISVTAHDSRRGGTWVDDFINPINRDRFNQRTANYTPRLHRG